MLRDTKSNDDFLSTAQATTFHGHITHIIRIFHQSWRIMAKAKASSILTAREEQRHDDSDISAESDYGSLHDEDVDQLLSQAESQPLDHLVLTSIDSDPVVEHASTRLFASEQLLQQNLLGVKVYSQASQDITLQVDDSRLDPGSYCGEYATAMQTA